MVLDNFDALLADFRDALPAGFAWASADQVEEFNTHGKINGVGKACWVRRGFDQVDLAIRHHPPTYWHEVTSEVARARYNWAPGSIIVLIYVNEYNNGWQAGRSKGRSTHYGPDSSAAWDDGYLDRKAGRPKWHTTYCTDHASCGEEDL